MSADRRDAEIPAVRAAPHYLDPSPGYDGQFYAELAVEPLVRDLAIDRALDAPAFRARRILFSWTAYALGFGRPAWILQAFAIQNVLAWLILAWLLLRWFPAGTARAWCLWTACLTTHGMLGSVRYALLDAPSALLLTLVVIAIECRRPWTAAALTGLSGLGRETNLLAGAALASPWPRRTGDWLARAAQLALAVLPLALWLDYLRSIYRSEAWTGGENIVVPFSGLAAKATEIVQGSVSGANWTTVAASCAAVAFVVQTAYVISRAIRRDPSPWLPLALAFAALGLVAHPVVWSGTPGAITRVALPLAIGFNVLGRKAPWPVLALGNLSVVPGVLAIWPH